MAYDDCKNDPERILRWNFVEAPLPYFNMAIEALQNLDRGNRVVERCVSYLSQLTILPIISGKSSNPRRAILFFLYQFFFEAYSSARSIFFVKRGSRSYASFTE